MGEGEVSVGRTQRAAPLRPTPAGVSRPVGAAGDAGPTGATGAEGPTGTTGAAGDDAPTLGFDGLVAYAFSGSIQFEEATAD